jgi:hypothetical protein
MDNQLQSPLSDLLTRAIDAKKPSVCVEAKCPKCRQLHLVGYIHGMRKGKHGYWNVWCENCVTIARAMPRKLRGDLAGQLFLPLGLKAKDLPTPPIP